MNTDATQSIFKAVRESMPLGIPQRDLRHRFWRIGTEDFKRQLAALGAKGALRIELRRGLAGQRRPWILTWDESQGPTPTTRRVDFHYLQREVRAKPILEFIQEAMPEGVTMRVLRHRCWRRGAQPFNRELESLIENGLVRIRFDSYGRIWLLTRNDQKASEGG